MQNKNEIQNWSVPTLAVVGDAAWLSCHNRAIACAEKLKTAYCEMLKVLIEIDAHAYYFQLEKPDLHSYCVEILHLPTHTAYDFTNVIRTSKLVPELADAVLSGRTSISKARRVCSVITPQNAKEWIDLVCECPLRTIKKAVAIANPRAAVEESMKYVSGDILEISFAVSEEWSELLRNVKDLLSQKTSRAVSTEEALFVLMSDFKAKNDPIKKAERAKLKRERKSTLADPTHADVSMKSESRYRPASVENEVILRDLNQCGHVDRTGKRCTQKRWLQKHHIVEFSKGGRHSVENLETLCSGHHRMKHSIQPSH